MLLLIPVILLILSAVAIQILGRTRLNIAQTWILAMLVSSVAWISFIVLRILEPASFGVNYLSTSPESTTRIFFNFNETTWVLGFLLVTILGAILLSDSSRLTEKNNLAIWSGAMMITATGIIACMAESIVAFILVSTFLDVSLLIIQLAENPRRIHQQGMLLEFTLRVSGTLILLTMLGYTAVSSTTPQIEIPGSIFPFVILGVILRLGIIHPYRSSQEVVSPRRNLQILNITVVPITMFVFLSRVTALFTPNFAFYSLFAGIMGLTLMRAGSFFSSGKNDQKIWADTISGLGITAFLLGDPTTILPLGIILVVCSGIISTSGTRAKWTNIILLVLFLSVIGLPFTPTSSLWIVPSGGNLPVLSVVYDVVLLIALLGITTDLLPNRNIQLTSEKWIGLSNDLSPILLIVSPWIFLPWIENLPGKKIGFIFAFVIIIVTSTRTFLQKRVMNKSPQMEIQDKPGLSKYSFLWAQLEQFFQLRWFLNIIKVINLFVKWLVTTLIRVLEGQGGLLWALVFLILITSILITSR